MSAHPDTTVYYNDKLNAAEQVEAEEAIAAMIFDAPGNELNEGEAADLGRRILGEILRRFTPHLVERVAEPEPFRRVFHIYADERDEFEEDEDEAKRIFVQFITDGCVNLRFAEEIYFTEEANELSEPDIENTLFSIGAFPS